MKILITGFDPFGGEEINPSYEAVMRISANIEGAEIIKAQIPTVYKESVTTLKRIMEQEKPDAVICVGQAGGRFAITPERIAINVDDARIKDNAGNQPVDAPIVKDGPAAYFSTLPIKNMVECLRAQNIPGAVSNSAGTFVCNHIMYGLLHLIHTEKTFSGVKGGFIHVPYCNAQVMDKPDEPYMSVDMISSGLEVCVNSLVNSMKRMNC